MFARSRNSAITDICLLVESQYGGNVIVRFREFRLVDQALDDNMKVVLRARRFERESEAGAFWCQIDRSVEAVADSTHLIG